MLPFPAMLLATTALTSGISPKQHWRLDFPSGSQTDTFLEISDWQIHTAFDGARQDASGGGSASTSASGFGAGNAFDSDKGTAWSCSSGNAVNAWLANNCGSAKDAIEMYVRGPDGATNNAPEAITVKYSDDGVTWTTDTRWPSLSPTTWLFQEYRVLQRTDQPGAVTKRGVYFTVGTSVGGWTNYTVRERLSSTRYPVGGSKVKITIRSTPAQGFTVTKAYIGVKGSGNLDFAMAPTQMLVSGASGTTLAANTELTFDEVTLSHSGDLVVAIHFSSGSLSFSTNSSGSGGYKSGDDATTQTVSGYTSYNGIVIRAEFTP